MGSLVTNLEEDMNPCSSTEPRKFHRDVPTGDFTIEEGPQEKTWVQRNQVVSDTNDGYRVVALPLRQVPSKNRQNKWRGSFHGPCNACKLFTKTCFPIYLFTL